VEVFIVIVDISLQTVLYKEKPKCSAYLFRAWKIVMINVENRTLADHEYSSAVNKIYTQNTMLYATKSLG